jgi:hypothetical protein
MPPSDTENPRIVRIPALDKAVGVLDEHTFFVGHSLGCQAIARYLETQSERVKVGGIVFVAGFFKRLTGLEEGEEEIGNHWLKTPLDFAKIKSHFTKSFAIFSDNDPFVPLDNIDDFKDKLDSEIITIPKLFIIAREKLIRVFMCILV